MSLRGRVIILISLVLLSSLAAGLGLAGYEARRAIREELNAAMRGGAQTIASAFEDLPRSDHQPRDLRQLVATFDGNRHVQASLLGPDGRVLLQSQMTRPARTPPDAFLRLLDTQRAAVTIPVPASVTTGGAIRLEPRADLDAAAIWAELAGVLVVLALATAIVLVGADWAIGQALSPLNDLSAAFRALAGGDYRPRVRERGPPEVVLLGRGFNAMAEDLAATNARNQRLERQLSTIQDEERAELARDLHDEIGPYLFAVNVDAQLAGQAAARGDVAGMSEHLGSIRSSVSHMQQLVREILGRLRPLRATELGLRGAIGDMVADCRGRHPGVAIDLDLSEAIDDLPARQTDAVYRTTQEALANALRHSTPSRISVTATVGDDGTLVLRVTNDGVPPVLRPADGGFGLIGMRERVSACGGVVEARGEGDDWLVCARFPAPSLSPEFVGAAAT